MFYMLEASDARERLDELGRFLEFWFGPRRAEFGESVEAIRSRALPFPLAWFYELAGRWPTPVPDGPLENLFYAGGACHHLWPLEMVEPRPDGRLKFYCEYQGDWIGLTLSDGEDPPVWIEGSWIDGNDEVKGEKQICASLSRFLVTHCLMALVYEDDNSPSLTVCATPLAGGRGWRDPAGHRLVEWFLALPGATTWLWDASDCDLNFYNGTFYLFQGGILVYRDDCNSYAFRAIHPESIRLLEAQSA
jgi:hypothetical protein